MSSSSAKGKRSAKSARDGRHNKIYHTPPTPPPEELQEKEKSFVNDCIAVSSISQDYSKTNPKLGPVIPPFNSQNCKHTKDYFQFHGVDRTLRRTGQYSGGTSIEGVPIDKFHAYGAGSRYLSTRNTWGSGKSSEEVDGHTRFMAGVKPVIGYHGPFGFRRNTPWLRQSPSPFGVYTRSPLS